MNSHPWSRTECQVAPAAPANQLGRWTADRRAGRANRITRQLQHARYAGQAAAVLLVVVGACAGVAQMVFG